MFTLAVLMSGAHASTFDIDFHVKSGPPVQRTVINRTWTREVGGAHANTAVASSWSYITCQYHNGFVSMSFDATVNNWPTSWPSTVTCSSGGYTLRATLKDLGLTDDYPEVVDLSTGLTLEVPKDGALLWSFELPSSHDFVEGAYPADLGGAAWTDVSCSVWDFTSSVQKVRVEVLTNHAAGYGLCSLPTAAGGFQTLPIAVVRP